MAFGFTKNRLSPIAIDFGADSVKLLQVVPGDPPQLVAAGAAIVPEHARQDPAARRAFAGEAVRGLLRKQPFRGKQAVLSFPAFQSLMQHIEIGRSEGNDVESQIGLTLRTRLNMDPARMVTRHFPVREFSRDGQALREVICLAAAREVVMGYIEAAQRCKLDVVGMHSEPIATLKAFEHLRTSEADRRRAVCFVDIGAAATKIVIAHGSDLVLARSVHAAGDQITRALAREQGMSFEEAAGMRRAQAVAAQAVSGGAGASGGSGFEADGDGSVAVAESPGSGAADETFECILDDLRLSLRYHARLFPDRPVEHLVFLGGQSRDSNACRRIAQGVGLPAHAGNPLARMARPGATGEANGVDLDAPQPGWAVAMGLCLCETSA